LPQFCHRQIKGKARNGARGAAAITCAVGRKRAIAGKGSLMKITDFLTAQSIIAELAGDDKPAVLQELADKFPDTGANLEPQRVLDVLSERERISTTAIGEGVAIPHGKLTNVDRVYGVFARSKKGVDFASIDGAPTYLFFALIAPEDGAADHLKALARISRLLKEAAFRARLLEAKSPDELFTIIAAEDNKL
jgi:PTS system nitrogen regulatory IIA component